MPVRGGAAAIVLVVLGSLPGSIPRAEGAPAVSHPRVVLADVPFPVTLSDPALAPGDSARVRLIAGADSREAILTGFGEVPMTGIVLRRGERLSVAGPAGETAIPIRMLPGWTSLLPPLVAILLAVLFRQVVIALLIGVWLGAVLAFGGGPFSGFLRTLDTYVLGALADPDHMTVLLFSFLMGGMLGLIQRMGGTRGIVGVLAPLARSARSGQVVTWIMGTLIFFDDYANTLLVGGTMRPVADRLRISREKLSYIVDATAAPVASIAIISTWIGLEVGLIKDAFQDVGITQDPFAAFMASIPFRFYPLFTLVFGFLVAVTGRDFGPMLRAERRARHTGKLLREGAMPLADFEGAGLAPVEGKPHRWINAALPILVMMGSVLAFIYTGGRQAALEAGGALDLKTIVGSANSYQALLWGSALGCGTAFLLAVGERILSVHAAVEAWIQGIKSLFLAALILTLAWSIGAITKDMQTARYLVHLLSGNLDPHWIPVLVFILSAVTSFATGTSWGTMGILMPLVIPLAHHLAPGSHLIMVGAISSVLAGSVWGDHCSPISDTTVLSSMASACDHIDHVNTQIPYAVLVGLVGMAVGDIPTAFGLPVWVSWILGTVILLLVLRIFGRKSEAPSGSGELPAER